MRWPDGWPIHRPADRVVAPPRAAVDLFARPRELVTGLWCRTCALPSGFALPFYFRGGRRAGTIVRCSECDGDDVEVPE